MSHEINPFNWLFHKLEIKSYCSYHFINKIVQGQHPANFSHCIFEQIEVMIIYPRRKNCSQHWYWKINVVAVLWLSIKSIVFLSNLSRWSGQRNKNQVKQKKQVLHSINIICVFYLTLSDITYRWCFLYITGMCLMIKLFNNLYML